MIYSRNIAVSKAAQIHTALSTDCIIATFDNPSAALLANVFQHAPPVRFHARFMICVSPGIACTLLAFLAAAHCRVP